MNGNSILLDTNIIIPILNREAMYLQQIRDRVIYVPSIVLGELYYGARHSGKVSENLARIETFKSRIATQSCDAATANIYGEIKQELRMKGHPIPENDIWIAAVAQQYDLPLVTHDVHFSTIGGLDVQHWP